MWSTEKRSNVKSVIRLIAVQAQLPQSRNHILDGIKKLRDQGATIVYTTHYMEEVEILCDRIIILDKGKIIAQGTSDELKKEANIEEKIERVGPTLNDVFLKLTGKELRD